MFRKPNLLSRSETAPGLSVADIESPVKLPESDFLRPASSMQIYLELVYHEWN